MSTNMNTKEVGMTFTQTKMLSNEEQHVNEIRNNTIKRRIDRYGPRRRREKNKNKIERGKDPVRHDKRSE